jgi:hypothetical protein
MTDASSESAENLNIDSQLIEQIQARLVTASTEELYRGIAGQLPPDQLEIVVEAAGIKLPSPAKIGKAFQDKIMPRVKDGICHKAKYCKNRGLFETASQATALAAKYTADAITTAFGVPVPFVGDAAGLLVESTALVLKNGLNSLCECPD